MTIRNALLHPLDASLVERFAAGDGVLWLGAGVSSAWRFTADGRPEEPGVLPASALINQLCNRGLHEDTAHLDLLDVGSRFVQEHGRAALNDIVREWYGAEGASAPRFYELLKQLPDEVATFVTTNYDPFTERAISARDPVVVVKQRNLEQRVAGRPTVIKAHGDAQDPGACVLTTGDYDKWEEENPLLRATLTDRFAHKTVVMAGYRARDRHFVRILNRVARLIRHAGGEVQPLYVVMPCPAREDFAVFDELGLDVVLIDATGEAFLESLLESLRKNLREQVLARVVDIIEAEDVRTARSELQLAKRQAAEPADQRRMALMRLALAERLEARGRPNEGLRERVAAVGDLRAAGAAEEETAVALNAVMERALTARLDPTWVAAEAQQCMAHRAYDAASATTRLALFHSAGHILSHMGFEDGAERMANRLGELVFDDPGLNRARDVAASWLCAEAALCTERFLDAAGHWRAAAASADDPDQRTELQIRAALYTGLGGQLDRGIDDLRAIQPHVALRALHQHALGWLLALRADTPEAADAFRVAAQAHLEAENVGSAVASLRNASWAETKGTSLIVRNESDVVQAYRLQRQAGERFGERPYDLDSLLEDANQALSFDQLRSAARAAERAAALAFTNVDPLGLEWTREVLAQVWVRTAELDPSSSNLFNAANYTALTGAGRSHGSESHAIERTERLLRDHATSGDITQLISELTNAPVGRMESTGALHVLETVADLIPEQLLEVVVHRVIVGLRSPWAATSNVDLTGAAIRLARVLTHRLSDAHAMEVRDELIQLLDDVPPRRVDDVLIAVGQYLERAPLQAERAEVLAERFLARLASEDDERTERYLRACLGVMAASATPELQDRILGALVPEDGTANWATRFWAWHAGRGPTRDEADRFLTEKAEQLEQILARECVEEGRKLVFSNDVSAHLAKAVAQHSSPEPRNRVLMLALRAAEHDEILGGERILWLDFASHLACYSESLQDDSVAVAVRIARGQFPRTRQLDSATAHPLLVLRADETPTAIAQANALAALGRLHRSSPEPLRQRIEAEWLRAMKHHDARVRKTAIHEIGIAYRQRSVVSAPEPLLESLAALAADPVADVRSAAYEALSDALSGSDDGVRRMIGTALRERAELETAASAHPALERALQRMDFPPKNG